MQVMVALGARGQQPISDHGRLLVFVVAAPAGDGLTARDPLAALLPPLECLLLLAPVLGGILKLLLDSKGTVSGYLAKVPALLKDGALP